MLYIICHLYNTNNIWRCICSTSLSACVCMVKDFRPEMKTKWLCSKSKFRQNLFVYIEWRQPVTIRVFGKYLCACVSLCISNGNANPMQYFLFAYVISSSGSGIQFQFALQLNKTYAQHQRIETYLQNFPYNDLCISLQQHLIGKENKTEFPIQLNRIKT